MNQNSVGNRVIQTAVMSFVTLLGHDRIFNRIVAEMQRVNEKYPTASGEDKKARVIADLRIIFDDLVYPISKQVINLLIEIGLVYLAATNPVASAAASAIVPAAQTAITNKIDADIEERQLDLQTK